MSNTTIDLLVRMLAEERGKNEAARAALGREKSERMQTDMHNQSLEGIRAELDKDLRDLNAYCDRLEKLIPLKRRKLAGERPVGDIPF